MESYSNRTQRHPWRRLRAWLPALVLSLVSCQEGGDAGTLFGQWQLTGGEGLYMAFAGSVVKLKSIDEGEVFGNFQQHGDSLFMQCYSIKGLAQDTVIVEQRFGMTPLSDIRVRIDAADSRQLRLSKGGRSWTFRKY